MDSVTAMHLPPPQPRQPAHLSLLPFDVFHVIVRSLDIVSVARLSSTCKALRPPSLYSNSPDWQILQSFTNTDSAAFIREFKRAPLALTTADNFEIDEPDIVSITRRRQLFKAIAWQLVATRNQGSDQWWARAALFHDVITGMDIFKDKDHEDDCVLNNLLDVESARYFHCMVAVAVDRLHVRSLKCFAALGRSVKSCWLQTLRIKNLAFQVARTRPPAALDESAYIELQAALMIMTFFGTDSRGDNHGQGQLGKFLGASGQPVVIMEAITLNAVPAGHYRLLSMFPELVLHLIHGGHRVLAMDLLDLVLLAVGTVPEEESSPLPLEETCEVDFGTQCPNEIYHDLSRRFAVMGVSESLFLSALEALRAFQRSAIKNWFLRLRCCAVKMDAGLFRWFMDRMPFQLDLIHAYSHQLPSSLTTVLPLLLERVPLDPYPGTTVTSKSLCTRCIQFQILALDGQSAPWTDDLHSFAYSTQEIRYTPRSFSKSFARTVLPFLASIPPPADDATSITARGIHSPWRTHLARLIGSPTFAKTRLGHVWAHICNSDPATTVNMIPFGDLLWAYVKAGLFGEALCVLQEARSVAERINRNLQHEAESWRWTRDEEVAVDLNNVSEEKAAEYQQLVEYLRANGLVDVSVSGQVGTSGVEARKD